MSFWTWAHGGQESGSDKSVRPQSTHQVRGQNSMVFQLWDFQGWLRGDRNDGRNVQNIHRRSFLSYWSSVFPTPRAPHFFEALSHPSSIVPGRPLVGKLFFLSIHCQNYVTKNKDQSKGKYKIKKPLFITTIKVCILNIIQNISQGATWMMGCACKRQTPHTPRETDRVVSFLWEKQTNTMRCEPAKTHGQRETGLNEWALTNTHPHFPTCCSASLFWISWSSQTS